MLAMGLLGSGHCAVMCGGVAASACAAMPSGRRGRPLGSLALVLAFNAGRIASYSLAGAVAGFAGEILSAQGSAGAVVVLRVAASLLMVSVGVYVAGFARVLRWAERAGEPVWRRIAPVARAFIPVRTPGQALALGSLWGWMPCGMAYGALAVATTAGSAPAGAATMAAFGLGTLPALVAMGSLASATLRFARARGPRLAFGAAIACFGLVQLGVAGRALAGAISPSHSAPTLCAGHGTLAQR
jgi:sulfite exporter TauE/SafE